MKEKTPKQKKVALNLRIPEDMKKALDLIVDEYNGKLPDFPINRNNLVTHFINEGLERWGKS